MPTIDASELSDRKRRVVMLTITEDCNLRCRYCYEPTKSRDRRMSPAMACDVIAYYMTAPDEFEDIEFDFFGGEPLLAYDTIRTVVDWFHAHEWPKNHVFCIGTNGTIMTSEIAAWLVANKECLAVNVSLDGNKAAHDINRSNSYDSLMKNLPFFLQYWPDEPAKMTISAESIPFVADSVIELEERGIYFTANIVFEDIWGTPEEKSALLEEYANQLERLVDYYAARPHLFPPRIVGHKIEAVAARVDPDHHQEDVRWCGAGHEMVCVDADGGVNPCHRFSSLVTGKPFQGDAVNRQASWQPDQCADCRFVQICPTCAGFNWQVHGDTSIRTTHHCEAFKLEARASAKLLALKLLGQPPEDILRLPLEDRTLTEVRIDAILEIASQST